MQTFDLLCMRRRAGHLFDEVYGFLRHVFAPQGLTPDHRSQARDRVAAVEAINSWDHRSLTSGGEDVVEEGYLERP
jgi:hypothetical protein